MRVDYFDFDLPEERIALRPLSRREEARLLVVDRADGPDAGPFQDLTIADISSLLRRGDALVINTTRVLPAQLTGTRPPRDPEQSPQAVTININLLRRLNERSWTALVQPARRLKFGDRIEIAEGFGATVEAKEPGGEIRLSFDLAGDDLAAAIETHGAMPLPPYIAGNRAADAQDRADYQTVYAKEQGAVAAPTAGLHLTEELLGQIRAAGVEIIEVVLHVGAGTFLPVRVDDTDHHVMHHEWAYLGAEAADRLNAVKRAGGRIVAVGTTSLRTLESAADDQGTLRHVQGDTDLFITPGYRFRAVDALLTNFHLPRSTLFMLVCAFAGTERMKSAYAHAIAENYRFYSYGDATFLRLKS